MAEMAVTGTHSSATHHHFNSMQQQLYAANLGMWVFLVTEVMLFGGLFAGFTYFRSIYSPGFYAGSRLLDVRWGATNTMILIASSLAMALAVQASRMGRRRAQVGFLIGTILLGVLFLGIKFLLDWRHEFVEGLVPGVRFTYAGLHSAQVEIFFCFYFLMTGLHAFHMIIGIGVLGTLAVLGYRGRFDETYYSPVEVSGLYWHFVDIVWIFLFPLLYLAGRHE
jgi:cytochrome c oxidase subunit 3